MIHLIKYFIFFFLVFFIINIYFFRYDNFKDNCHIKIGFSLLEMNHVEIKDSIKLLKNALPQEYMDLCQNVSSIKPDLPCGGTGGGCFRAKNPRQIEVSVLNGGTTGHTSAIVMHEVCHAIQNKENRSIEETECYAKTDQVINSLLDY